MSDNGFHLDELGLWSKMTLLEEALRVPLIIRARGIAPGVSNRVVELLDIYPTTLELAGLPPAPHVQGHSLTPLLRQPDRDGSYSAFSQLPNQEKLPGGARITKEMGGRSVHQDRWHYTAWAGRGSLRPPERCASNAKALRQTRTSCHPRHDAKVFGEFRRKQSNARAVNMDLSR